MAMTLDGSNGVTFNDSSLQGAAASPFGLKNRIINGAMMIDQRNAGASVTPTDGQYTVDRWQCWVDAASKLTAQQSTTVPTGYKNSLLITSTSAYSIASANQFSLLQPIEGLNVSDLGWGAAGALTVTLSFWARSSLTGTFGGWIRNSAGDRSYVFSYSISSANTWEYKSVTIAGDTTGTWLTTNGVGIYVGFSMGAGSSKVTTAGSWGSTAYYGVTGQQNLVANNGATFYVTGTQLEIGSTATPFERRLYNQELANCQRYFETNFSGVTIPQNTYSYYCIATVGSNTYAGGAGASQQIVGPFMYRVTKRASPTVTIYSWSSSSTERVSNGWTGADFAANSGKLNISGYDGFSFYNNSGSNITTGGYSLIFNYTASAEL